MDADALYGLPLDEFVPERSALAKVLRGEGRREDAAHVAKLRKPSVAGWAVNQLVRTQGRGMQELFDAGDALRDAQANLLAGRGDGRALRSANEGERAAVDALVETARGLLTSDGHELSPAIIERVSDTLHAAALDETAREQVREGRLERELRHVGMGLGEGTAAPPPTSKAKTQAPTKPPAAKERATAASAKAPARDREARERATAERADAKRAEAERAATRKAVRVAEAKARRRAERAASALRAAEERRERASEALAAADDALATAHEEAEAASAAHERAKADLERD